MNLKHIAIASTIIALNLSIAFADNSTTRPAEPDQAANKINAYARRLESSDPIEAEAGIIGLSELSPTEFPAIVAAGDDVSLSAKAREQLKTFIERERPWQAARQRIGRLRNEENERLVKRDLDTYDKIGKKDPKWDAAARQAIRGFGMLAGSAAIRPAAEQAIAAGCDDPFILYIEARMLDAASADPDSVQQLYERAAKAMYIRYPVDRMYFSYMRAAAHLKKSALAKVPAGLPVPPEQWLKVNQFVDLGLKPWLGLVKYHPSDQKLREAAELAIDIYENSPQGRKAVFDQLYGPLQQVLPDTSNTLTIKGYFYIAYAWDARGCGWASDVTPEGWKLMSERLDIAEEALTKAWEKDNTNSEAAALMLKVELGQGKGRDRMELWFKRAMEANPDNREACMAKMNYLQPKWYGTPQDMLAFGHECYETHNWYADLPFQQIDAIVDLHPVDNDERAFLASPEDWKAFDSVYQPCLRFNPKNAFARSRYCNYACLTGHWDLARQQFAILGSAAVASQFGGVEAMEQMRATAEQKGVRPNVP